MRGLVKNCQYDKNKKISICIITVDVTASYIKMWFSENCTVDLGAVTVKLTQQKNTPNKTCNELTTTQIYTLLDTIYYLHWCTLIGPWQVIGWSSHAVVWRDGWPQFMQRSPGGPSAAHKHTNYLLSTCAENRRAASTAQALIRNAVLLGSTAYSMLPSIKKRNIVKKCYLLGRN